MNKKEEFLKKILATFRIEAEETIKKMTSILIELEKNPSESHKMELIETIFREAHSLKGASRAVNIRDIESVCQSLETVFSALKNKIIELAPEIFDVLHQAVDILKDILLSPNEKVSEEMKMRVSDISLKLSEIEAEKPGKTKISKPEVEQKTTPLLKPALKKVKAPSSETIRISVEKLDSLLFQVEEMLALKLTSIQKTEDLRNTIQKLNVWNKKSAEVYPFVKNIRQVLEKKQRNEKLTQEEQNSAKIMQFHEWANLHIKTMQNDLIDLKILSDQDAYSTGMKIEKLLENVKKLITVPFSALLDVFPKTVRDISRDIGKEIDFTVNGDNTKIDRRILEEMRNPLLHIVRNCIDYGIEKPEVRLAKNKPKRGKITFDIERMEKNKVKVLISDDGAGIDLEKLKKVNIKNEEISEEEAEKISEQGLLDYIFKSGISTSDIVTDISGRGLGLAIVQEKIENLGGSVSVETKIDVGTKFKIQLPLSLVTFRGVLIQVADNEFVVPTSKVERVLRLKKGEVKTVENKAIISFKGKVIPIVNLSNILELPFKGSDSEHILALIFGSNKKIGFSIDKILNEQEVLVKKFNKHLARVRNISGATILGSGKVVPVLNISDLLKSALKETMKETASNIGPKVTEKKAKEEKNSVLIVEDSITSRMLLKNILETAGYQVATAIDGVDGFTKLKEANFSAVVSDVDMPKMNGFDLTLKIRSDKTLSEMPIVLVTALSKKEDRERGIEVGANAYIVKSSFDQSNLLEVLGRLV